MRGVFIYILLAVQVTLCGQSADFNFKNYNVSKVGSHEVLSFEDNFIDELFHAYAQLNFKCKLSKNHAILSIDSEPCTSSEEKALKNWVWSQEPRIEIKRGISNDDFYSSVIVYPYFLKNGLKHKIKKIKLNLEKSQNEIVSNFRSNEEITESVLSSGSWFKFKIHKSGIYQISYENLIEKNIISGPIPSNQIAVFGNSSRMLDFTVGNSRPVDLSEIPSKIIEEDNSFFTSGSSILFYSEADGNEYYDSDDSILKKEVNLYSDTNFIYITTTALSRKTIPKQILTSPTDTIYDYVKLNHHEKEWVNFIKSGRQWFGESFNQNPLTFKYTYNKPLVEESGLKIEYRVCARSNTTLNNKISLILNNDTVSSGQMNKVSSVYYTDYVKFSNQKYETTSYDNSNEDSINIQFFYHQTDNPKAWLDYFTLNTTERIITEQNETTVHLSKNNTTSCINISSSIESPLVWDISNLNDVYEHELDKNDSGFSYNALLDTNRKFIICNEQELLSPTFVNKINNQNLHGLSSTNYLIITKQEFLNEANRLVNLHNRRDSLSGQAVVVDDIYNEFSCGRPEATAIRDFIKLIYEKGKGSSDSLNYVLLLGEGSYDSKNRISNNINFIPTFQSINSVKLTSSYVTDDFFGLMDDHEGTYLNGDMLDLSVGRLPVKNQKEAEITINKIYEYYDEYNISSQVSDYEKKSLTSKGNWKNNIVFIGDDEDFNEHMKQSDALAQKADTILGVLNQKKIFIDAFPQESTTTGDISPETNRKLNKSLEEGTLIVNYTGHGGELGWAEERILLVQDIHNMSNRNRLPLFVTATCEFSRFDSPEEVSAGEHLILQHQGGAIALFTTVRLVFSIPNFNLNETFYSVLESSIKKNKTAIGDIFKNTKVTNNGGLNDRNFTLLGDPAVKLTIPKNKIILDSVTHNNIKTDTIKSLSTPTLHGKIMGSDGLTPINFNGWIDILLYDKKQNFETLANDNNSVPFSYSSQEDLLFVGKGVVTNGKFSSKIFIPKDIRQNFDFARLSFYALDTILGDASGYDKTISIGGIAENYTLDNSGPNISLYLDDTTFVFGNNVSPSPIFIASLTDSSGINIIPNDIGKDLVLTIDERSDLSFVLNNFYTPSSSSFQKGEVIFPIDELEEGRHSLEFKAFDNQNNSSKAYTEFIIENNPKLALNYLLNYPNPFTTNTGFYFEHNQTSEDLEIQIHIFTVSGKIIKSLEGIYSATSKRIGPINWDGLDEYGDKIGKGVYVYQITVKNSKGETDNAIQKLVLLR